LKKHPQAADELEATLLLLSEDAFDPRLKTHRLKAIWPACGPVVQRMI
jgi:mRNA-degrading endonuclease YafQ of YafQ-DinJ toxin-antitoxin module